MIKRSDANSASQLVAQATAVLQAGDGCTAIELFREAARLGSREGAYQLGVLLRSRAKYVSAEAALRQAHDLGDTDATLELADLISETGGRHVEARRLYESAIERGVLVAWAGVGFECLAQGESAEAFDAFTKAIAVGDRESYLWRGHAAVSGGDLHAAKHDYRTAAQKGVVEGWRHLGRLALDDGEFVLAEQCFRRGLGAGDSENWFLLGHVLVETHRLEEAQRALLTALKFSRGPALLELGHLAIERENLVAAKTAYEEAAAHGEVLAYLHLAVMLEEEEDFVGADELFRAAIQTHDPNARRTYAERLLLRGEVDAAQSELREAVQRGDDLAVSLLAEIGDDDTSDL